MLELASERCRAVLERSRQHALRLRHSRIGVLHVFLGMLDEGAGVGASTLRHLGIDVAAVRAEVERRLEPGALPVARKSTPFDDECRKVLGLALVAAKERGSPYVGTEHLLLGLLGDVENAACHVLVRFGVTRAEAAAAAAELKSDPERPGAESKIAARVGGGRRGSVLDAVGIDLCQRTQRRQIRPVCGRFIELETLKGVLAENKRPSALLVGPRGCGRTSTLFALARDILIGAVPSPLLARRLIAIEPLRLIAGCRHKDQFEERIDALVQEIERRKDVILVFDDADWLNPDEQRTDVPGAAADHPLDDLAGLFERIRPAIERGRAQCVAALAVDPDDSRGAERIRRLAPPLRTIDLIPADSARVLVTLLELREQLESHHRATITEDSIKMAVQLALGIGEPDRLLQNALRLVDATGARLVSHAFTPPVRATRLTREIARLETERVAAFERKDYTEAARSFDEARANRELLDQLQKRWRNDLRETVRKIDEAAIVETWTRANGAGWKQDAGNPGTRSAEARS